MQRSRSRILTTHTGSLPRPRDLTRLYAARARGEAVDEAEIDRAGREAVRAIVRKQRDAGIDVGNNGEQQRDSFFLYLKARLSGLGGSWERPSRADVERYPDFKRMWTRAAREQNPGLGAGRAAQGDRRGALSRRSRDQRGMPPFQGGLGRKSRRLCRTVHERAISRHPRHGGAKRALRHARELSRGARDGRLRSNTRPSCATGCCCRSMRPISRSNAT